MSIKISILLFAIFTTFSSIAQYKNTKIKMAEELLEKGKIYAAIDIYKDILKKDHENKYIINEIARLHEQLFSYSEASKWYYKLMEIEDGEYPKSEFKYAQIMKMKGLYDVAIKHYKSFSKTYKGNDKARLVKICKTEIKSCKTAKYAIPNSDYTITKLSNLINSSYSDVAPFWHNGSLYYSTIPSDTAITYKDFLDSTPTFQIYVTKQVKNEKFETGKLFIPDILNIPFKHSANGSFNKKGDKFFFTRCKENVNGKMICKIYCTVKKDNIWQEAIKLNNKINDINNDFTSTHPTIMSFKKGKRDKQETEILIYASTRPGGFGGYDIWGSVIKNDLTCEKSINLGKNVNSLLNEVTPFYDGKNKFFFSSNGRGGYGGFDVFKASVKKGKIKKSKIMDLPVNSSWDDWYYNEINSKSAFISSNRKSSRIYYKDVRLDDIFYLKKETKKYLMLKASSADSLKKVLNGVVFKVKLANDVKSEGKNVKPNIPFQILPNKSYEIIAEKLGYINQKTLLSTSYNTQKDTILWEVLMSKIDSTKEIVIDNIYFDSNSSILKPESKAALNRLFQTLRINPNLVVEIGAHTDKKGSKEANQILSEERAQSVVKYLTNLNIKKNRLSAIGYGSLFPVSSNRSENNRKLNRRITFKIIGSTQNTIQNESK